MNAQKEEKIRVDLISVVSKLIEEVNVEKLICILNDLCLGTCFSN